VRHAPITGRAQHEIGLRSSERRGSWRFHDVPDCKAHVRRRLAREPLQPELVSLGIAHVDGPQVASNQRDLAALVA
jgi:hypothetical protein